MGNGDGCLWALGAGCFWALAHLLLPIGRRRLVLGQLLGIWEAGKLPVMQLAHPHHASPPPATAPPPCSPPTVQVGGMCGEPQKPTPFMCLILKMLQIQPDKDIVVEFIKNDDFKYLRLLGGWWVLRWHGRHRQAHVLLGCCADVSMLWCRLLSHHHCPDLCLARRAGAFYMRLVGRSQDVYQYLEPLYNDYRKVRVRNLAGRQELTHVDEVSDGAGRGVGAGRGEGLGDSKTRRRSSWPHLAASTTGHPLLASALAPIFKSSSAKAARGNILLPPGI